MKIRKEVMEFAKAMETRLRNHDKQWGKTGWRGDKKLKLYPANLFDLHMRAKKNLIGESGIPHDKNLIDTANLCMMIYNLRVYPIK